MSLELRSERPGDEDAIDVVNCRAFRSMDEANIVRLMRETHPAFDPRLSVTAWDGDELVGHALWTPARIRLMGETVDAMALGPISVLPERQRQGIGGEMIRFGHDLGRAKGFSLSFLHGVPSYYPRHGYRACFGFGKTKIDTEKLPAAKRKLQTMPVRPGDIAWLAERCRAEWADVDFGWLWGAGGPALGEWTISALNALMWWTEDGRRAAYTVAPPGRGKCTMLLADDPELAREVVSTIRPPGLDHHPSGWLARNVLDREWATVEAKRSKAAMAFELQDGALNDYLAAVESGERPPGACIFPVQFIAC